MTRRGAAAVLALALIGAGCSGGSGVTRKAVAAVAQHRKGPVRRLAVARSSWLPGEPGGIAADDRGAVVEVDDKTVVAFDAQGRKRWSSPVPGAALSWPWLGHGLVVVPTLSAGDLGKDASGPDDSGGCVAIDRATGARRWSYEEEGQSGVAVASVGARVFCVFGQGVIAAVDIETGALVWRALLDTHVPPAPISVSERTAIAIDPITRTLMFTARIGTRWYLAIYDLASGADRGVFDLYEAVPSSAPVSIGPGLVAVGSGMGQVCTFDIRRGVVSACVDVPAPDGFDPASIPAVADGVLVIAGREGSVTAIDIATWRVRWSELSTPILDSRLSVVGDVVLFADWTRVPHALRTADGTEIGLTDAEGFVISTAAGPAGGFAVAVRGDPDGRIQRWLPES